MPWTEFQEAGLLDTFWREGSVCCPDAACGASLEASLFPTEQGPFEELNLKCPRCGTFVRFTRENDRHRAAYRDWTAAECEAMGLQAEKEELVFCPVDGSRCEIKHSVSVPNAPVPTPGTYVGCMRCGREFIRPWKR